MKVKPGVGEQNETVWLIDWAHPEANDFAVAEEVTVLGQHTKRPDVVLYVNGIALVTLELKRSTVAVSEGIRQTIGNQKPEFIRPVLLYRSARHGRQRCRGSALRRHRHAGEVLAQLAADSDIDPARVADRQERAGIEGRLDQALVQLCTKQRLLEIIHDFMVFDAGVKKACRPQPVLRCQGRAGAHRQA